MAAVDRNSDGSYDAVDSGGFGKDYHGQDAFGERIGGTGIGGSHFGGFEEGHFGVGDGRDHYEREATSYGDIAQTETMPKSAFEADNGNESEAEASSGMKDSLRDLNSESSEENSEVGSLDTSFQIGGIEENEAAKEKMNNSKQKMDDLEQALSLAEEEDAKKDEAKKDEKEKTWTSNLKEYLKNEVKDAKDLGKAIKDFIVENGKSGELPSALWDALKNANENAKENTRSGSFFNDFINDLVDFDWEDIIKKDTPSFPDTPTDNSDWEEAKSSFDVERAKEKEEEEKAKSSFTDKMEESKEEAKAEPGTNMSSAKTSPSDYLTKANKDSTKELPKDLRNDFVNHATNTLKGVVDRIADNSTAKALGLKSVEEFAKENGYDPDKLSTMKAYQKYQNKQIRKALPNIVKKVGSYFIERIKDFFDPSQLPERILNTIARYNPATLIGAAILSIQSGAGIQASIDQALTMVDPEDQPDISDFLEDVLKDRDTVKDLSNAIDGALAPEENSNTSELDESIVNIGRKDNTDYDDFNAGLGTTSDADAKVFIARNVKADPILRRMISKIGK